MEMFKNRTFEDLWMAVFLTALLVCLPLYAGSVHAQEGQVRKSASSALIEEVVVTAPKRAEQQQDVPIAITAFNAD